MADSDAEWIGVDFEFGKPATTLRPQPPVTTRRPRRPRPFTERPEPRIPLPESPHDAPDVAGPSANPKYSNVTLIGGLLGGLFIVVLLLLVVYMVVLRKRLNKAKTESNNAQYQLRVEDVAHMSHLDETSNMYVNTTDLQKLLSSVRAKKKSEERPPTMPKIQHQTPTPYRSTADKSNASSDNNGYASDPDVVVVRAPMPLPYVKTDLNDTCNVKSSWQPNPTPESDVLYSNIEPVEPFKLAKPPSRKKVETPAGAPPPPPTKQNANRNDEKRMERESSSSSIVARPAPPPPKQTKSKPSDSEEPESAPVTPEWSKPSPPVVPKPNKTESVIYDDINPVSPNILKPFSNKPEPSSVSKPTPPIFNKPTLPTANKPIPPTTTTKPTPPTIHKPLQPFTNKPTPPAASKPTPPAASKPTPLGVNKPTPPSTNKPNAKPTPPVAAKPGVAQKGRGLPPLKMALLPSLSKSSIDSCTTPDTGIIELTPDNTPTPDMENDVATASISSKIAFLEGKMTKTTALPSRAMT